MYKVKKYKLGRRLGTGVFEKCQTQKFAASEGRRTKKRGRGRRPTDYGLQLIEKQKVRYLYGISERQFRNYIKKATESKTPSLTLFMLLESRLDNIVYRMGLALTRRMARQMTSHGHFLVNGKRTTTPSYQLGKDDVVSIREGSKSSVLFADLEKKLKGQTAPLWVKFDAKKMSGTVVGPPTDPDPFLNLQTVIELYSR